jgi:hypothetical protein
MEKLYTTEEVAEHYRTNPLTLAQWRYKKKGPKWIRSGKRVLYSETAIAAYDKELADSCPGERESA